MAYIDTIARRVDAMKHRAAERDYNMANVLAVRRGEMAQVFPDMFPTDMPHAMVANFIDVAARDLAEVLAPLPSINCSTTNITSDRARAFADKRSMIANNYIYNSRLQTQMYPGADQYFTYGFLPIHVEPDWDSDMPRIRVEDPTGVYYERDRFGRLISYAKRYKKTIGELANEFPEYERAILGEFGYEQNLNAEVEVIRYMDKNTILLYVPSRKNLVLSQANNPVGKMTVLIAERPSIDGQPRGQFDDVLFVQLARARFANLAMEAAESQSKRHL